MVKKVILLLFVAIFLISLISFIFPASAVVQSAGPINFNRTASTLVNITINNTETYNVTQISITLPADATYIGHYNGTDGSINATFTVVNASGLTTLIWKNGSNNGLIPNYSINQLNGVEGGIKSFWFNVSFATAGDKTFVVTENITAHTQNQTNQLLTVNFAFQGRVKNETGQYISKVNVSLYQFIQSTSGPPTERYAASTISDASGIFNFTSINGSATQYKIKMILSNSSDANCYSTNSTCPAEKTGTVLPPFPSSMFYPPTGLETTMDFSLNGTTFYLQPAATLRLYATSCSSSHKKCRTLNFGYEVMDQKVGFPIESNVQAYINTTDIIVPAGRSYSVMLVRDPSYFLYTSPTVCNGTFFNDTTCPSPPVSNSTFASPTAGQIITFNQSLAVSKYQLYGCITPAAGVNNTKVNITYIKLKIIPWTSSGQSFIPSIQADTEVNLTDTTQLNNSRLIEVAPFTIGVNCTPGDIAAYNLSVLGSATGINYMVEMYAKNTSIGPGLASGNENYLASFQNITITANTALNFTLYKLAGIYTYSNVSLNSVNTSMMKINIQNSTGQAVTNSMHVEVKVKNTNTATGITNYMIETLTNGTFYIPILNNSNWAEVSVFPNNAPPIKRNLNLSMSENNVTLVTINFAAGGDKGMRSMNSTGGLEMMNVSNFPVVIRFLLKGTDIEVTSMNATSFNPLKALVAGSVDLELKVTATNVTMKFNNFDMFSAKQPPMFAIMDNNKGTQSNQVWKFGNFVPKEVYDNVTLTIPYDSSTVPDDYIYNMSVPTLYSESSTVIHQFSTAWSLTDGYTDANLTDEFLDYNNTRYRGYLSSAGINCSKSDPTAVCFMNTTSHVFVMEIPHFSGLTPNLVSSPPGSSATTNTPSNGGGTPYWTGMFTITSEQLAAGYTKDLSVAQRIKMSIESANHYVGITGLTSTTATINVSSPLSQEAVFNIGDEKKFEVTNDNYYDLLIKLVGISSNKANVTIKSIHELIPATVTPSTTGDAVNEGTPEVGETTVTKSSWTWIVVIAIVVIIAIVSYVIYSHYRKRRYYHKGY